jgi:hypothetical protein
LKTGDKFFVFFASAYIPFSEVEKCHNDAVAGSKISAST